jgi:hypothetical protein
VDRPAISIAALTHLRRLLDAQPVLRSAQTELARAILPSNDSPAKGKTTATVRAGRPGSRRSSRRERTLHRAPESDTARSAPRRGTNGKWGRKK